MGTRKANLESWIGTEPDKKGYYHGFVWMGVKGNGKPDRRHVMRATLAAVRKRVRELERERDAGVTGQRGKPPTVQQMLERHLSVTLPARRRAPRTIADYWSKCRNDIFPRWGAQRIDRLLPDQIEDGVAEMLAAGHAPSHVRKVLAVLSSAYELQVARGRVARNPCATIEPPESDVPEQESLTETEVSAVLEAAMDSPHAVRWALGLACGLRQGEALGLRWGFLGLDEGADDYGEMKVWHQIQRLTWEHGCGDPSACGERHHKVKPCPKPCRMHTRPCPPPCQPDCAKHALHCPQKKLPQGITPLFGAMALRDIKEKRRKTLPIPTPLVAWLQEHREEQEAARRAVGAEWEDYGLVFCQWNGRPISPRADWEEWQSILKAAGLPPHRVHAMRHSTATIALGKGIAEAVVQELLGHSDIRVTRNYLHVSSPMAREAAERMGEILPLRRRPRTATKTATKRRGA